MEYSILYFLSTLIFQVGAGNGMVPLRDLIISAKEARQIAAPPIALTMYLDGHRILNDDNLPLSVPTNTKLTLSLEIRSTRPEGTTPLPSLFLNIQPCNTDFSAKMDTLVWAGGSMGSFIKEVAETC